MAESALLSSLFVLTALAVLPGSASAAQVEMLWNPGPDYLAGETLANAPGNLNACTSEGTFMSEGALVGNPPGFASSYECLPKTVPGAPNGAAPSFYIDTRSNEYGSGWTYADMNHYPGWSVWWESGGAGTPIQFQFLNSSLALPITKPCRLTEVGLSYQRWPDPSTSQFKGDFRLSEFEEVDAAFETRVSRSVGPPRCTEYPTADVSADFHLEFINWAGETIQYQLLGVLLYIQPGTTLPPENDPVFWEGEVEVGGVKNSGKLLIGSRLSPPISPMVAEGSPVKYTIDFKKLIEANVVPPPGFSIGEAVVSGLDVYTSARGADLNLQLSGVNVYGVK